METQALAPLQSLESSLNALVSSLTTTNTFSAAPTAAKDLTTADDALTAALHTLHQHQQNYARILNLRAEASRLEDQIKSIIRTCVDLKAEIGAIHPSILTAPYSDDEDDDDEDDPTQQRRPHEVDYKTLLTFAARIGKHNSLAALEAERESTRRKIEAAQRRRNPDTNGVPMSPQDTSNATAESRAEVAQLEDAVAAQRAHMGMAFPPGEILRNGALGRLQVLREREGEEAVEREVERLVRQSENVAAAAAEVSDVGRDVEMDDTMDMPDAEPEPARPRPQQRRRSSVSKLQGQGQASRTAAPRRKLDLDFPGSDDDDDD